MDVNNKGNDITDGEIKVHPSMHDWDKRYSSSEDIHLRRPCRLLTELLPQLPKGRVLDIACGEGRNAIFLAKNGYDVDAVDSSCVAIERASSVAEKDGLKVNFIHAKLEEYLISPDTYDIIIDFYYLQRSLAPAIKNGLAKDGVVLFETYTVEQKKIGPPRNPEYLLQPNELLRMFDGLHILFYREGIFEEEGRRAIASLAGRRL
jgi:SAM-dependent methyltransferase